MKNLSKVGLLVLLLGISGCVSNSGCRAVVGSGRVVTETRAVSGWDQVSISGSGKLVVTQGAEESLTIRTDDNLLPLIESKVSGGRLAIGPTNNLKPTGTIFYTLRLKNLRSLQMSGSLEAQVDELATDNLTVQVSGSGKVMIGKLAAKQLEVALSGSGEVMVAGQVKWETLALSGSGHFEGTDLASAQADAQVSGSGTVTVWAREHLSAEVSGSGRVNYYGSATVESQVSGSGGVRNLGPK